MRERERERERFLLRAVSYYYREKVLDFREWEFPNEHTILHTIFHGEPTVKRSELKIQNKITY